MLILSVSKIPKKIFLISNLIAISKELSTTFNSSQKHAYFCTMGKEMFYGLYIKIA